MLLRLQGRKAGEYMRFEKPGYMLGFFVGGVKGPNYAVTPGHLWRVSLQQLPSDSNREFSA